MDWLIDSRRHTEPWQCNLPLEDCHLVFAENSLVYVSKASTWSLTWKTTKPIASHWQKIRAVIRRLDCAMKIHFCRRISEMYAGKLSKHGPFQKQSVSISADDLVSHFCFFPIPFLSVQHRCFSARCRCQVVPHTTVSARERTWWRELVKHILQQ